jgi:glucose-induced degradation protein 8
LHFKLRRLQLIELIRAYFSSPTEENTKRALEFANQDLAPFAPKSPEFLQELQEAMGLFILAPPPSATGAPAEIKGPLSHLLEPGQRRKVAEEVNQAILLSQDSRQQARLFELVKTRYWAEKLAREKKIDLPARLDMGLDGEKSAENGSNGHANGNGEDAVMGDNAENERHASREV